MAEAVFTGKNVKKFALDDRPAFLTFSGAKFARLTENLFLRHRPRHGRDDD
jgi:hypothetical protein